ncbi:PD40 domain-containing protein [Demequina aestuarii]|uniref:PD40 domain-containing protein n=1 Tax=Demequina aestuarii TaxID=327095 RepID=UPI000782712B|nr:PD40 domain-containing protein [Demequina aestuarii]
MTQVWTTFVGTLKRMPRWQQAIAIVAATLLVVAAGAGIAAAVAPAPTPEPEAATTPAATPTPSLSPTAPVATATPPAPSAKPSPSPSPTEREATVTLGGPLERAESDTAGRGVVACAVPNEGADAEGYVSISFQAMRDESRRTPVHPGDDSASLVIASEFTRDPSDPTVGDALLTARQVAWSPDSSQVAFVRESDATLFVLDVATQQLTTMPDATTVSSAHPLVWSPDGSRLAYVVTAGAVDGVRIAAPGDRDSRVMLGAAHVNGVAWAPDGDAVAMSTSEAQPHARGSVHGSTVEVFDLADDSIATVVEQGAFPAFSPDGLRLAVFADRGGDGTFGTWVIDLETGDAWAPLGEFEFDEFLPAYWERFTPQWSPDGSQLAFAAPSGENRRFVGAYVADLDSRSTLEFADRYILEAPLWNDDGTAVMTDTGSTVLVLELDATTVTTVERGPGGSPQWIPGSDRMSLYGSACPDRTLRTIVLDESLDSAQVYDLGQGWAEITTPAWSPDGRWILTDAFGPDSWTPGLYLSPAH